MRQNIYSTTSSTLINADLDRVWQKVGFYEHVQKQPGLLLRLSLPVPVEVQGRHRVVGDTCRCKYSDGGYLTKRITVVDHNHRIEFEIIEQSIRYQNTVKLLGGYIELLPAENNQARVNMVTYYKNRIAPAFLSKFFVNAVIRKMHRFVMQDMRAQLAPTVAFDTKIGAA